MNNVFILKDVYKVINKLKKENIKIYKKILKKIEKLQSTKLERLEKLRDISKMEINNKNIYIYELDDEKLFAFTINDDKIYIMDYFVMIDGNIDSVLMKNYEEQNNEEIE